MSHICQWFELSDAKKDTLRKDKQSPLPIGKPLYKLLVIFMSHRLEIGLAYTMLKTYWNTILPLMYWSLNNTYYYSIFWRDLQLKNIRYLKNIENINSDEKIIPNYSAKLIHQMKYIFPESETISPNLSFYNNQHVSPICQCCELSDAKKAPLSTRQAVPFPHFRALVQNSCFSLCHTDPK